MLNGWFCFRRTSSSSVKLLKAAPKLQNNFKYKSLIRFIYLLGCCPFLDFAFISEILFRIFRVALLFRNYFLEVFRLPFQGSFCSGFYAFACVSRSTRNSDIISCVLCLVNTFLFYFLKLFPTVYNKKCFSFSRWSFIITPYPGILSTTFYNIFTSLFYIFLFSVNFILKTPYLWRNSVFHKE